MKYKKTFRYTEKQNFEICEHRAYLKNKCQIISVVLNANLITNARPFTGKFYSFNKKMFKKYLLSSLFGYLCLRLGKVKKLSI